MPSNSTRRIVSRPPKRFCASKISNPANPAFAVVIGSDAFGQMLGGDRCLMEGDAGRVHFRGHN